MSLAQLPLSTVKLITSSQIITSVSSAVKELFENALDAGATSIDVKLVNYGLDRIEVKDNGSGISKANTACMALPHYTSKISNFNDLETLETYGFRGEALNALCKISNVTLTTATACDPMAMVYTLDASGNISGSKPSHHVQGTTVVVSHLFKNLPVRRQLMGSNRKAQDELRQVEAVVKSLAVIKANIRVTLSHNKCLIWQKKPSSTLQNSFAQLIGFSTCQQLELLSLKISEEVCVNMLIPKRNCDINAVTKSNSALSLVFVNDRPVTYKKIIKILHQNLTEKFGDDFSSRKFAICLLSVTVSASCVDVNLEPNKTKVLLRDEDIVVREIQQRLEAYYSISALEREIPTKPNESLKDQDFQENASSLHWEENGPRKRRKVDDDLSNGISVNSKTLNEPETFQSLCSKSNIIPDNEIDESTLETLSEKVELIGNTLSNEEVQVEFKNQDMDKTPFQKNSFTLKNTECVVKGPEYNQNIQDVVPENHIEPQLWKTKENEINEINFSSTSLNGCSESRPDHQEDPNEGLSNSSDLENLWETYIQDDNLNTLSKCLDTLVSVPETSMPAENVKGVDIVGSEAWSMGRVSLPKGDILKGSCVFVGGQQSEASAIIQKKQASVTEIPSVSSDPHAISITNQTESIAILEENPKEIPKKIFGSTTTQKSPRKSPRKNPRTADNSVSPGLDSSLQSVSSQMGRRELSVFTKFAREIRPQIILENPGISFTLVASKLAERWQGLSDNEREHYEEMARETAAAKKVWKSYDNQKKLDWVKKLPEKKPIKKTLRLDRLPRKEVFINSSLDDIKLQAVNREHQFSTGSNIRLLGQLEPSGNWLCLEKSVVSVMNPSRLQELVVNHRLLNSHTLMLKPLSSSEKLNQEVLGEEAWKILVSLPCKFNEFRQTKMVSADIIVKNGFKVEVHGDNDSAALTEVAEALNYYGVKELKETLTLARAWPVVQLSDCRPLRVVNHLKSEAMRICRKSPSVLDRNMVEALFDYWRTAMLPKDVNCLHFKPIYTPIYNIAEKSKLYP